LFAKLFDVVSSFLLKCTQDWHHQHATFHLVVNITENDNMFDNVMWPLLVVGGSLVNMS